MDGRDSRHEHRCNMPRQHVPGYKRVNFRCEGWFSDLLAEAARRDADRGISSFIRAACIDRMRALGMEVKGQEDAARGRGRPPAGGDQGAAPEPPTPRAKRPRK
jgi:hypothetical protein